MVWRQGVPKQKGALGGKAHALTVKDVIAVWLWEAETRRAGILSWLARDLAEDPIKEPAAKRFCPANREIPMLDDYRGGPGRAWFEEYFGVNEREEEWPFPVRTDILEARAEAAGMRNMRAVRNVCWEWKYGVDIGVSGDYQHTVNENNESVYTEENAPQVMDALVSWHKNNIILGPRWNKPENVTVIKLTCREKGPGKCRWAWYGNGRCKVQKVRVHDDPNVTG